MIQALDFAQGTVVPIFFLLPWCPNYLSTRKGEHLFLCQLTIKIKIYYSQNVVKPGGRPKKLEVVLFCKSSKHSNLRYFEIRLVTAADSAASIAFICRMFFFLIYFSVIFYAN